MPAPTGLEVYVTSIVTGVIANLITDSGIWLAGRPKDKATTEVKRCLTEAVTAFINELPGVGDDSADRNTLRSFFEAQLPTIFRPLLEGDRQALEPALAHLKRSLARPDDLDDSLLDQAWAVFIGRFQATLATTEVLRELSRHVQQGEQVRLAKKQSGECGQGDFGPYLKAVETRTAHLNIRGIAREAGVVKDAGRYPIEALYTPLTTETADLTHARNRETGALELGRAARGLERLLPSHRRLLIEGAPGAGKTTFLHLIACMYARDALEKPLPEFDWGSWVGHHLGIPATLPRPIPALIELGELVPLMTDPKGPQHRDDNEVWLLDALDRRCRDSQYPVCSEDWSRALGAGRVVLLLDGLDEIADPELRERVFNVFRAALDAWPQCRVVVTSRPFDTEPLRDMEFFAARIAPFDLEAIAAFLDRWVAVLYDARQGLEVTRSSEAERERTLLQSSIVDRRRIRRLARNPVMLTCLCVVHWNEGHLPDGKARLYGTVIRWLLRSRKDRREAGGHSLGFADTAFSELAYAMMTTSKGKQAIVDIADAADAVDSSVRRYYRDLRALAPKDRRQHASQWLRRECLWSGVVEEVRGNRVRFWHLTFQEYLAARWLAWLEPDEWWHAIRDRLADAQWREVVELLPGCLFDEGGQKRVDRLLRKVLDLRGQSPDLAGEARAVGVFGRLLDHVRVYGYEPDPDIADDYDDARRRALCIFENTGADVPFADRLAAAEALGQAGDPRLASGCRRRMLHVPGREKLQLAKYPVTVQEYEEFLSDGGYERAELWPHGWAVRKEKDWTEPDEWEQQVEHPNRPIVGVSWFEAVAFCHWLSLLTGERICLPTEVQWQAATENPPDPYPWGEAEPTAEHANFAPEFSPNVGHPTPVGLYPRGAGPAGHLDLAGNVWEWCAAESSVEDIEAPDGLRPLRGGSWNYDAGRLRAAARYRSLAESRFRSIGFRVALVPASTA